MSDGDAALTDTHTGRVHAIARAAFYSSCASFRERMSASVLPIWSADTEGITGGTFLTGNVGGGVKWYASNDRWGLRGDYRFTAVRDKDDAPSFFGRDTRYGHRAYGGLIINVVR